MLELQDSVGPPVVVVLVVPKCWRSMLMYFKRLDSSSFTTSTSNVANGGFNKLCG